MLTRTRTPIPGGVTSFKVLSYAASTNLPCGISRDRKTLYAASTASDGTLKQSTDDGATWTTVTSTAFGTVVVTGVIEMDSGEVLVVTTNGSGSPSYVWKSSGWAASHTTATWTLVLTTTGGSISASYSAHSATFGNDKVTPDTSKIGVMGEAGGQTTGSGDQTAKGRRVYLTQDYGSTWTQILDIYTYFGNAVNVHVHGVAYDPWAKRIWVLFGDTQQNSPKTDIMYSDDLGATWTQLDPPDNWGNFPFQMTTVHPMEDYVAFGADNGPGIFRLARKGYRVFGQLQMWMQQVAHNGGNQIHYGHHANRDQADAPLLMADASSSGARAPGLAVSLDGFRIEDVWTDPALAVGGSFAGFRTIYGPTYNGVIAGWIENIGGRALLRGELVPAEPGTMDYIAQFTGDGTTTVFNIPHGLPYAPVLYDLWAQSGPAAAGAFTKSTSSTNLFVTFTAAPTNGAVIRLAAYAA